MAGAFLFLLHAGCKIDYQNGVTERLVFIPPLHNGTGAGIRATFEVIRLRLFQKLWRAAPPNFEYLRTNLGYILCANFDFLGQKVRLPVQVKVRCALRERLQT